MFFLLVQYVFASLTRDYRHYVNGTATAGIFSSNSSHTAFTKSAVVELEAHAIVYLVVLESDVVLVDCVPFLNPDLLGPSTRLSRNELLQITDGVIFVALHPDLLPQPIV